MSPQPNLIHPIPVTILRANRAVTIFDPRARSPIRSLVHRGEGPGAAAEALSLEAQVNFNDGRIDKSRFPAGGKERKSLGYLLFRLVDLVDAGVATDNGDGTVSIAIAEGDRITRIGFRRTNYFVSFFRDAAGYDDASGLTLLEVNFVDRNPASTRDSEGT